MVSERMETTIQQVIPVFNGESYGFWKIKMKTILKTRKLWEIIENEVTMTSSSEDTPEIIKQREERSMKDIMALQILQTAVSDSIFPRIASASKARDAWNALELEFQGSTQVRMINLQTLRREYEILKMEEGETINDFTTKLINLSNQLRVHGEEKTDYLLVQKVLISLPEKFDSIVAVLEQTKDLSTLSMTELVGTLKAHERRLNIREERVNEGAFYGERFTPKAKNKQVRRHEKTKKWCGVCKRDNHNEVNCWKQKNGGISQASAKNVRKCYVCDKPGHIAKECRLRKKEKANLSLEEEINEEDEQHHMLFSAVEEEELTKVRDEMWLVDSGCTNHMTKESEYFVDLDRSKKTSIEVGNGQVVKAEGKGSIKVLTNQGVHIIKDVLLVPSLSRNLLSVGQMISHGYRVVFEDKACIIEDPQRRKILEIQMKHKSFPLRWNNSREDAFVAHEGKEDNSNLWHKRFGHINHDKMETMQRQNAVEDLPKFQVIKGVCESCEKGKQSRRSFPKISQSNTSCVLDLIHSDVCGPMQTTSMNGSRYFLTFIDDYSRMIWVYFMKNKSEVLPKFKIFKAYAERQSARWIKKLRTDGGGEYVSREFIKLCQECGIHHEKTTPYSPQQNGVAERRNRTLVEMARSMMMEKNLPNDFWAEAIATSTYLQNVMPSKALEKGVTPLEIWSGKKPSVKHLKIFGCICYSHIPDEKRRKLDSKAKQGIFIGYSNESKGYRVYFPSENKVEISRDVKFDEEKTWCWEKKEAKKMTLLQIELKSSNTSQAQEREVDLNNQVEGVTNALSQLHLSGGGGDQMDDENSIGPRGLRSMDEVMQRTSNVEEMANIHEMCMMLAEEPTTFEEASNDQAWKNAMKEEIRMIEKNNTWELVEKPKDKNIISVKWIYRLKTNAKGEVIKHKARLVARGFTQEYGVDYLETFAPVSRYDTIRTLMMVATQNQWRLFQMDVKSAFLNGDLKEEVYIEQPPGFEEEEGKVLKLYKALYGLKQAPRAWYARIDGYFLENGFERSVNDAALYVKKALDGLLVVSLYVDDIIITGDNLKKIRDFKEKMKKEFEMTDLGELDYFLGMEVMQKDDGIFLSQEKYAKKLLRKFKMEDCKGLKTPMVPHGKGKTKELEEKLEDITKYRSMIGGILYLCASRPDIMYASSYLSRYMASPMKKHLLEAKRVLRYIKNTLSYGVHFKRVDQPELIGFSDSDWGGSIEDKKSTSGYVFKIGSSAFCWNSSKQKTVAQSTAEAEYIAVCSAANQAIWLQRIVNEIGFKVEEGVKIFCDNKSAIAIGKNPVQHRRTKHIDIKYHFVRQAEQEGKIKLEYCPGELQMADIFTKPLTTARFETLREELGVKMKP